jgi:hypothetical protein
MSRRQASADQGAGRALVGDIGRSFGPTPFNAISEKTGPARPRAEARGLTLWNAYSAANG